MKIAWIGTGVMGYSMAQHLIDAGHQLSVYNRSFEKTQGLNAHRATSIEEVVKNQDVIFTMVGYPKDVEEVYEEIFRHASSSSICVDMTTSDPKLAKKLYEKGLSLGIEVLDAPVSGGDIGAKNASLAIMVGGKKSVFDQVYPLFEKMGKSIQYLGDAGNGQYCKMANQIVIAGNLAAASEAIRYAQEVGLDPSKMLAAIAGGSAGSWQINNNGPKMISKDYAPGFYIHHFIKDLRLVLGSSNDIDLAQVKSALDHLEAWVLEDETRRYLGTQAFIETMK